MGRPKALLDLGGRCVLDRILDAYDAFPLRIVVGPPGGFGRDFDRTRLLANPDASGGLLGSLQIALRALPPDAEGFCFQPVDVALVRAADVAGLLRAGEDPDRDVFIPSHAGRRGHPVLCRRVVGDRLLALPAGATPREALYAEPSRVAHVEAGDGRLLMDMDTPEDYARMLAAFREGRADA
jgi:CTP:molybdopterin cytidylyltransferase MocA